MLQAKTDTFSEVVVGKCSAACSSLYGNHGNEGVCIEVHAFCGPFSKAL